MPTDFKSKGISWVGNICQKLETLYYDMDNIVAQDAVRYAEGHAENVGENMKFYSDVVQDLIPPCPGNYGTQVVPPETQVAAQESGAVNGSEDHRITEELNQSLVEAHVTNLVKNNQCDAALYTSSSHGKDLRNSLPFETCGNDIDCPSEVLDCDEPSFDTANGPSEVIDTDEAAPAASNQSFPIDNISCRKVSSSHPDYSSVHDDHDGGSVVSVHVESMTGCPIQNKNVDETTSNSNILLSSELIDAGMETIDLSDKEKDEDSCVIVDNSSLYDFSFRQCRNKSYKKTLQHVFSSKRRVKEYKLLAIMHEDFDDVSGNGPVQNDRASATVKASDSEWEIL